MRGRLVFAFLSKENFSESRIREISAILARQPDTVFIITSPTKRSFCHYIEEIGKNVMIYNRGDYIPVSDILSALWGFQAIWMFYADSEDCFDLTAEESLSAVRRSNKEGPARNIPGLERLRHS